MNITSHIKRTPLRTKAGLTLIELILVVAMVSVIAAYSYSSYTDYMKKARRIDATNTLRDFANLQEGYLARMDEYTNDITTPSGLNTSNTSTKEFYEIEIEACQGGTLTTCYLLKAKVKSGEAQEDDEDCQLFTLDSRGRVEAYPNISGTGTTTTDKCWHGKDD